MHPITNEPYGQAHGELIGNTLYRLEKFVYQKGTNVALYNAERSKRYRDFKKELNTLFNKQVGIVAKPSNIDNLLLFTKAAMPPQELMVAVGGLLGKELAQYGINITAYLTWAGTEGGQAALDKLGLQGSFNLRNQALIDYFEDYGNLMIRSVDNYTKEWIARTIQEGKELRFTPQQIANKLVDEGKTINEIRAKRIVLTETAKAMSYVEMKAATQMGIREVIWRTSVDERVCPICAPLEGKRTKIGFEFGDGFDGPPAHVSCRCFLEEVVPEEWQLTNIWLGQ